MEIASTSSVSDIPPLPVPARNPLRLVCRTINANGLDDAILDLWDHAVLLVKSREWQAAAKVFLKAADSIKCQSSRHELEIAILIINATIVLTQLGDFHKAAETLCQAPELDALTALKSFLLGHLQYELNDTPGSEVSFNAALQDLKGQSRRFGFLGLDFELAPSHVLDSLESIHSFNDDELHTLPANCIFEAPVRPSKSGVKTTVRGSTASSNPQLSGHVEPAVTALSSAMKPVSQEAPVAEPTPDMNWRIPTERPVIARSLTALPPTASIVQPATAASSLNMPRRPSRESTTSATNQDILSSDLSVPRQASREQSAIVRSSYEKASPARAPAESGLNVLSKLFLSFPSPKATVKLTKRRDDRVLPHDKQDRDYARTAAGPKVGSRELRLPRIQTNEIALVIHQMRPDRMQPREAKISDPGLRSLACFSQNTGPGDRLKTSSDGSSSNRSSIYSDYDDTSAMITVKLLAAPGGNRKAARPRPRSRESSPRPHLVSNTAADSPSFRSGSLRPKPIDRSTARPSPPRVQSSQQLETLKALPPLPAQPQRSLSHRKPFLPRVP